MPVAGLLKQTCCFGNSDILYVILVVGNKPIQLFMYEDVVTKYMLYLSSSSPYIDWT